MPVRDDIATCSFPEMRPEYGQPIRISRGFPRYKLKYDLPKDASLRLLWPGSAYFMAPIEEFDRRFLEDLDRVGVDRIEDAFFRLKEEFQVDRLVLLCFERLAELKAGKKVPKSEEGCHRTLFATWWLQQTGQTIPELGMVPDTDDLTEPEATLL